MQLLLPNGQVDFYDPFDRLPNRIRKRRRYVARFALCRPLSHRLFCDSNGQVKFVRAAHKWSGAELRPKSGLRPCHAHFPPTAFRHVTHTHSRRLCECIWSWL